ncbi:TPA: hypothetical protein O1U81_002346 [Staphylococcus aureus]|nr:hypothetical protein [Staphylococcus aureus]
MSASISCKLAGPQQSEIGSSISTDIANWENGPQHSGIGGKSAYNNM